MSAAGPPSFTGAAPTDRELVTLDRRRCIALLTTQPVGRLVFTHRALPEVLPVNYCLADGRVLLCVGGDSQAARACRDTVVAFQADRIEPERRVGWSVTVVGYSAQITDPAEWARMGVPPPRSWLGDSKDHFIGISMDHVTGREIVHTTRAPSSR